MPTCFAVGSGSPGRCRYAVTASFSPYFTRVGTAVTMSASTGQAEVWITAFTNVLLPRLNSPTTATVTDLDSILCLALRESLDEIGATSVRREGLAVVDRRDQGGDA